MCVKHILFEHFGSYRLRQGVGLLSKLRKGSNKGSLTIIASKDFIWYGIKQRPSIGKQAGSDVESTSSVNKVQLAVGCQIDRLDG